MAHDALTDEIKTMIYRNKSLLASIHVGRKESTATYPHAFEGLQTFDYLYPGLGKAVLDIGTVLSS